jgi:hypothetical protein
MELGRTWFQSSQGNLNRVLRRERSGIDLALFFAIFFTTCQTDSGRWVSAKGSLGSYEILSQLSRGYVEQMLPDVGQHPPIFPPRGMVMAFCISVFLS